MRAVFSPGNGEVEVYELLIPESWAGRKLGELLCTVESCLPVALTRTGRSSLPTQDTVVETGDVVAISATADGIACLRNALAGKEV